MQSGRIPFGLSSLQSLISVIAVEMTNSATKSQNGHFPLGDFPHFSPVDRAGKALEFVGPEPLLLSQAAVKSCIDFHTTPSVPLQTGVKFEHFVNPLRVESNVYKKRRL